jgi:hypothetical protein
VGGASQTLEDSITSSAAKKSKYENPFNSSIDAFSLRLKPQQPAHIEFKAEDIKYEEPKRKYRVDLDTQTLHNIVLYREKYEKYLKIHNKTATKDVWRVYDHIAADIFHELFNQSLVTVQKDMEEYIEKVIVDEF